MADVQFTAAAFDALAGIVDHPDYMAPAIKEIRAADKPAWPEGYGVGASIHMIELPVPDDPIDVLRHFGPPSLDQGEG